jgi:SAM-dependent methyltransferase
MTAMGSIWSLPDVPLFDLRQWARRTDGFEDALLDSAVPPVLDIGCGPGRMVTALHERGIAVLGIDATPAAIMRARRTDIPVVIQSVFDPVAIEGGWATVLLFDGNIGIGADPVRLLIRVSELLRAGGRALVELQRPGTGRHEGAVQLEVATGMVGLFPWSWVAADEIDPIAHAAGLVVDGSTTTDQRWFTWLRRSST